MRREEPEVDVDQRPTQKSDGEDHPHHRAVPTHGTVTDSHCQKSAHPDGSCSPQADARAAKSLISSSRPRHLTLLPATMRQSELMHVLRQKPARTLSASSPQLADANEPVEDLSQEGDGLLDPVVAQSASNLGDAALADDEQTPPYTPP